MPGSAAPPAPLPVPPPDGPPPGAPPALVEAPLPAGPPPAWTPPPPPAPPLPLPFAPPLGVHRGPEHISPPAPAGGGASPPLQSVRRSPNAPKERFVTMVPSLKFVFISVLGRDRADRGRRRGPRSKRPAPVPKVWSAGSRRRRGENLPPPSEERASAIKRTRFCEALASQGRAGAGSPGEGRARFAEIGALASPTQARRSRRVLRSAKPRSKPAQRSACRAGSRGAVVTEHPPLEPLGGAG